MYQNIDIKEIAQIRENKSIKNTPNAGTYYARAREGSVSLPKESEKATEPYLAQKVRQAHGMCIKITSAGSAGLPDRLCVLPGGVAFWVELKSEGQKPRKLQQVMIDKLRALGQPVFVCDTKARVDEVMDEMEFISEGEQP